MKNLSKSQAQLLIAIDRSLDAGEGNLIAYHSEWLGYLPYGMYHWVTVNGQDISSNISKMESVSKDLERLAHLSFLVEVGRETKSHETGPDDVVIQYKSLKRDSLD